MLPGIESGMNTAVFQRVNQRVKGCSASALLARIGASQGAVFFSEKNFFTLLAAFNFMDDFGGFHRLAPSVV